jgi:hypothetical protein
MKEQVRASDVLRTKEWEKMLHQQENYN